MNAAVARAKPNHEVTLQLIGQCQNAPIVFDHVRPDLCPTLEQIVLAQMHRMGASAGSLNVGGWKSPETAFQWNEPAVQELRATISHMIGNDPVGWAMVNSNGSFHKRHQHRNARLVGVYYVTPGDPVTPTVFECKAHRELAIDPHPGRVVLSLGTMWHRVDAYTGQTPRITIAFEIKR